MFLSTATRRNQNCSGSRERKAKFIQIHVQQKHAFDPLSEGTLYPAHCREILICSQPSGVAIFRYLGFVSFIVLSVRCRDVILIVL